MAACSARDNVRSIMSRDRSVCTHMDKMLGRKRTARSDEVPPAKKRGVSVKTVQKRITESNKEIGSSVCFFQLPFMISYAIHVYNL